MHYLIIGAIGVGAGWLGRSKVDNSIGIIGTVALVGGVYVAGKAVKAW